MEPIQHLKDAVAINTSYLAAHGDLLEPLNLAQSVPADHAAGTMLAMAHLTSSILIYATDLAAAVEAEGITVEGVPGGTSPTALLQEFARQILEEEAD